MKTPTAPVVPCAADVPAGEGMMPLRSVPLLAALLLPFVLGCHRSCVPEPLANPRKLGDLCAGPEGHAPVGPGMMRDVAEEFRRRGAGTHPPGSRPYHFLALSGGGLYGSFGVGVLCGWTEAGTRPTFDVVTGISTGALMATFAFLGPEYDGLLRENFIGVTRGDIARTRSALRIAFADAVFTSRPLKRRIDEVLTPEIIAAVARAHREGRRLYIGTTNIDTRRLVIWDMGAIACRGTPEAVELYHDVILASSSIPGAFPPVRIPVEIDGKRYEELHVDGGVSDEVIFRAFMVADLNRMNGGSGAWAPPGSTLYVVSNGKLYADSECVSPVRVLRLVRASFRSVIYGKTRDELYRIYLNCLESGVDFRLTAIPQEFRLSASGSLQLPRDDQQRLFETGRLIGNAAGCCPVWRDLPPGTDPDEQALPRAGTRFATIGNEECGIRNPESEPVVPGP
jgi:hypothetical protein